MEVGDTVPFSDGPGFGTVHIVKCYWIVCINDVILGWWLGRWRHVCYGPSLYSIRGKMAPNGRMGAVAVLDYFLMVHKGKNETQR